MNKVIIGLYNFIKYRKIMSTVLISRETKIFNFKNILFSKNIIIGRYCILKPTEKSKIKICEGVNIGPRCILNADNFILIEKNVIIAPNVFISDHDHQYRDVNVAIKFQGTTKNDGIIKIGEDSWIGTNSVIVGNVIIGKHVIIGANSLVNKNIPDYCVAVGNPAKNIKRYDNKLCKWIKEGGEK